MPIPGKPEAVVIQKLNNTTVKYCALQKKTSAAEPCSTQDLLPWLRGEAQIRGQVRPGFRMASSRLTLERSIFQGAGLVHKHADQDIVIADWYIDIQKKQVTESFSRF
jgi:hypothetical protein